MMINLPPTSDLDEESIKLIKKVEKMIVRLNVKGVPIQIQDLVFTNQRDEQRNELTVVTGCRTGRCDRTLGKWLGRQATGHWTGRWRQPTGRRTAASDRLQ